MEFLEPLRCMTFIIQKALEPQVHSWAIIAQHLPHDAFPD